MVEVSIILPVKNEREHIQECLSAVYRQDASYSFEVIVIDSGSTDGTLEIVRQYPVKLLQISPKEFKHSSTRNIVL